MAVLPGQLISNLCGNLLHIKICSSRALLIIRFEESSYGLPWMFLILKFMASRCRLALYTSKVLIEQKGAIRTIQGFLPMDQWWKKNFSVFTIYKLYRAYNSIIDWIRMLFQPIWKKQQKSFLKLSQNQHCFI